MRFPVKRVVLLGSVTVIVLAVGSYMAFAPGGTDPTPQTPPPLETGKEQEPSTEKEKEPSRTDVVVAEIKLPQSVSRNKDFEYVVVLKNVGFSAADGSTVTVRAGLVPGNTPNLALGEAFFVRLQPGESKSRTIRASAPHLPGVWRVNAIVKPSSNSTYIDEKNNLREAQLVVN